MKVTLEYTQDHTPSIKSFWLRPKGNIKYVAGQFTEVFFPHKADERGQKRWFTLSSSPTQDLLSITTRFVPNGSSFKKELLKLEPGQEIDIAEPMGDFILPKDKATPLLFIAGGIGITPFISMLTYLKDTAQTRDITLLYAAQTEQDLIYTDLINALSQSHHFIVSNPSSIWTGLSGHITLERIKSAAELSKVMVYFSGPEPMVESFYKQLRDYGIPPHRLVMDYFPGYKAV